MKYPQAMRLYCSASERSCKRIKGAYLVVYGRNYYTGHETLNYPQETIKLRILILNYEKSWASLV